MPNLRPVQTLPLASGNVATPEHIASLTRMGIPASLELRSVLRLDDCVLNSIDITIDVRDGLGVFIGTLVPRYAKDRLGEGPSRLLRFMQLDRFMWNDVDEPAVRRAQSND